MSEIAPLVPLLAIMLGLMVVSGFFSASEAALFYLRDRDLRQLARGDARQVQVTKLLERPDRVLSGILFWNLLVNVATFALSSMITLRLERSTLGSSSALTFAILSLLMVIFFSEMLPKSIAVLKPKMMAAFCVGILRVALRLVDPILPILAMTNLVSLRIIWPGFSPEPYLEVADLERAIKMSGDDATLEEPEQRTLENVVSLSETRVDEWMRPRGSFPLFDPPLTLEDLRKRKPTDNYVLITDGKSDEVAKAIWLPAIVGLPDQRLDYIAEPVVFVPWCTTVAHAMEKMVNNAAQVAAVINEYGETIGVATLDDLMDTVFAVSISGEASPGAMDEPSIREDGPNQWIVSGVTSLRMLSRETGVALPESRNVTVRGVIQEALQRLAVKEDRCRWGQLEFVVLQAPTRGRMRVQVSRVEDES